MNEFRTIVKIKEFPWKISYDTPIMMIGSCFSENMGNRLQRLCFPVDLNPFGILYNPESIAMGIEILLNKKEFSPNDLFFHQGRWNSYTHHGSFSSVYADETLNNMNSRLSISSEFLKKANILFITFGTAWVYRRINTGEVVANCHKVPAKEFDRSRLSVSQIVLRYKELLRKVWEENPELKVVFSVSPIRHWKDGPIENQVSKSTLILAIDQLKEELGERCIAYFPSYEIIMDDLRDYRFYESDMLHPSKVATDYIWEKFTDSFMIKEGKDLMKKVNKIVLGLEHRPIDGGSENYNNFLKKLKDSCQKLMDAYDADSLNELYLRILDRIEREQ